MQIVRQRVSGNWANNRECPTTELAVMMLRNNELVAAGRAKMLTAGDIESRCAALHRVLWCLALNTPVDCHSKLILDAFRNVQPLQLRVT